MLLSHYAPHTELVVTDNLTAYIDNESIDEIGILAFKNYLPTINKKFQEVLSPSGSLEEAAHNLYSAMHRLDCLNLKRLVAERVPNNGVGLAINDKLERASFKK
jgi:L-threonylcarbamoyladenylate synthase